MNEHTSPRPISPPPPLRSPQTKRLLLQAKEASAAMDNLRQEEAREANRLRQAADQEGQENDRERARLRAEVAAFQKELEERTEAFNREKVGGGTSAKYPHEVGDGHTTRCHYEIWSPSSKTYPNLCLPIPFGVMISITAGAPHSDRGLLQKLGGLKGAILHLRQ